MRFPESSQATGLREESALSARLTDTCAQGNMKTNPFKSMLSTVPTGLSVALGFAFFVGIGLAFVALLPPARDLQRECSAKCQPLPGWLVDDKTYPLSAKRQSYPKVCKCGSAL